MAEKIDIQMCIEEIALSGRIGISNPTKASLTRLTNSINKVLESDHVEWRVKVNTDDMCIEATEGPKEQEEPPAAESQQERTESRKQEGHGRKTADENVLRKVAEAMLQYDELARRVQDEATRNAVLGARSNKVPVRSMEPPQLRNMLYAIRKIHAVCCCDIYWLKLLGNLVSGCMDMVRRQIIHDLSLAIAEAFSYGADGTWHTAMAADWASEVIDSMDRPDWYAPYIAENLGHLLTWAGDCTGKVPEKDRGIAVCIHSYIQEACMLMTLIS